MELSTDNAISFVETNPLNATGPGKQLFIAGAAIFEITTFEPPVQRITVVGVNLPDPDTFGPFNQYVAIFEVPGDPAPLAELILQPTMDYQNWAASTLLFFGGTLPPINVSVRPRSYDGRIGPIILQGSAFN